MAVFRSKTELRTIYKEKRLTLSNDEVNFLSKKIFDLFNLQFSVIENQNVSVFLPIEKFNEINTQYFVDYFFRQKINVFVPKIIGEEIGLIKITPTTEYEISSWGIKEPKGDVSLEAIPLDFVLVPLLYCDGLGNRIGYGKGFYDKFFLNNKSKYKKIGLSFFNPNESIKDVNGFDVKLDYLVTPFTVLDFNK